MKHPFEGIVTPEDTPRDGDSDNRSRRAMLKLAAAAGAGLIATHTADAQPVATTMAIGEEGGKRPPVKTTRAIGEEGGRPPGMRPTTKAIGEEGAGPSATAAFEKSQRAFEKALSDGKLEEAYKHFRRMLVFARYKPLRAKVDVARKDLAAALAAALKQADADLKADKLVEAVKAYRMLTRISGFPEQAKARAALAKAAKKPGYKAALREVQAQEMYDSVCGATRNRRLAMLKKIAAQYGDTPTGKKAGEEAKKLAATPAPPPGKMTTMALGEEGAAKPPRPRVTTKAIGEEGAAKPVPRPTTLAIGEEG